MSIYELGRYEEAIECYDKAIEQNVTEACSGKGLALGFLGRYEEAIECLDKTIAIDPAAADAWSYKGNAMYELGRYEEAIECYDKAIAIDPSFTYARNSKALVLKLNDASSLKYDGELELSSL